MPELPEVETIRRQFEKEVVGRGIVSVEARLPKLIRGSVDDFSRVVGGAHFTGARRRSKVLILDLSNGFSILVHLKMSGQLLYLPASELVEKHTHVIFHLDDGRDLRLRDLRQFGYLKLVRREEVAEVPEIKGLGPEPLDAGFTIERFREVLSRRPRGKIKSLLLDQSLVAGIGNIYVDEALFYARINPQRPAGSLTREEEERLYQGIRELLNASIRRRGTSVALYVDLENREGENQNYLKVYDRAGRPCEGCEGKVERIKVAGRGTYYCPSCQS